MLAAASDNSGLEQSAMNARKWIGVLFGLLILYVSGYFCTFRDFALSGGGLRHWAEGRMYIPHGGSWVADLYAPMHWLDEQCRPQYWESRCYETDWGGGCTVTIRQRRPWWKSGDDEMEIVQTLRE
jgi:hypothetical protein